MKLFLLILATAPFLVSAQSRKDNTILVSGVEFKKLKKALSDNEFFIAYSDEENQACFTAPRSMPKSPAFSNANIEIFAHVKDSAASLSAKVDIPGQGSGYEVDFRGPKNALNMQAFLFLDSFAKSFGKPVTYKQQ